MVIPEMISNYLMWSNYGAWFIMVMKLSVFTLLMMLFILQHFCFTSNFWLEASSLELSINMNIFTYIFLWLLMTASLLIFLWSSFYMIASQKLWFFYLLFVSFVSSMSVLLASNSLFMIFLGWEGLGVTSFLLIVFFQNWMSANSGLLTLLTNRLGDAMLLMIFCYWMAGAENILKMSVTMSVLFSILCFTKSAQWPFMSWLPAAMAAPTPVSALVHSSTLVTAGIWLLLRYSEQLMVLTSIWILLGSLTLMTASLAALLEQDAKKIVALSTLSQLGLMMVGLGLGSPLICFFHVMMHALAKANLFMVVGSVLHYVYSEQDKRKMSTYRLSLMAGAFISVTSLSGLCFISGFYSKEMILENHYSMMTSSLSLMIYIIFISVTLTYSMKLLFCLSNNETTTLNNTSSLWSNTPVLSLSMTSLYAGWMAYSSFIGSVMIAAPNLLYFTLGMSAMVIILKKMSTGFLLQTTLLKWGVKMNILKSSVKDMSSSLLESFMLLLNLSKSMQNSLGNIILVVSLMVILML